MKLRFFLAAFCALAITTGIASCAAFQAPTAEQKAELTTVRGSLGYALDEAMGLLDRLREERSKIDDSHPSAPTYDRLIGYLENGVRGGQEADQVLAQITNEDGTINPGKAAQTGASFLPPPYNTIALSLLSVFGVGGAEGTRRYVKAKSRAENAEGTLTRLVKAVEDVKPEMNGDRDTLMSKLDSATTADDKATIERIRKVILA